MRFLFLTTFALLAPLAFANSSTGSSALKAGLGLSHKNAGYDADAQLSVVPLAFYDNDVWYIEGTEAGFYPHKSSNHHIRLGLTYDGKSFDPKNANNRLQHLDERKSAILAHASHLYVSKFGGIRTKLATDVSNRHQGTTLSVAHISRFNALNATIYPSFGVTWQSKDYNDYYYGVDAPESLKSGVATYQADSGISPFVSLTANYDLNERLTLFGNGRGEWASKSQKDSPMTDSNLHTSATLGLLYRF